MTNKPIDGITEATNATLSDELHMLQGGNSRRISLQKVYNLFKSTAAQFLTRTANLFISPEEVWSAAENKPLTSAASIEIDFLAGFNFKLDGLAHNATFTIKTSSAVNVGQSIRIIVIEDGTGGHDISWGAGFVAPDDGTFPEHNDGVSKKSVFYGEILESGEVLIVSCLGDIA